jgi:hypothetical protein
MQTAARGYVYAWDDGALALVDFYKNPKNEPPHSNGRRSRFNFFCYLCPVMSPLTSHQQSGVITNDPIKPPGRN